MKLIVEMEMPSSCRSCKLCVFIGSSPVCPLRKYPFDTVSQYFYADKKPTYCPIKGVLPEQHGDLIDKETAKNAFDSSFITFRMKDGETMRGFYQRTIDELPVLIVAERKDDGTTAD